MKLLVHYRGEAVEAVAGSSEWVLREGPCPDMPPKGGKQPWQHKQYLCYQPLAPAPGRAKGGKKGSRKGYWEEGLLEPESIPGGSYEFGKSMVLPPRGRASWLETRVDYPDWTNQRHRCFVPCLHTQAFHWVCEVLVTSLGMLFKCRHLAKWREEDVDALKETKVKEFHRRRERLQMKSKISQWVAAKKIPTGATWCRHCQMWLAGPTQWRDHIIGKSHRKHTRLDLGVTVQRPQSKANLP